MKKINLLAMALTSLFAIAGYADSIAVTGMSCSGCEKQVTSVVCKDKEMSNWFETCSAKVVDAKKEMGEIRYTLKKGVALDADKKAKIAKAVEATGRSVAANPTATTSK